MLRTALARRTAAVLLAISALTSVGVYASTALFTDTAVVGSNTFTTTKVDIAVAPASAVFTASAMVPGDVITTPVTVSNATGSVALRYSLRSVTTEDVLAAGLTYTVRTGVSSCTTANFTATGTQVYSGILGSVAGTAIFGNPTQGQQTGDRTLAVSATEVLCMQVTLPTAATNTLASKTTTATFTFDAEQTANNP